VLSPALLGERCVRQSRAALLPVSAVDGIGRSEVLVVSML
jgi:hypothetical protein